MIDVKFWDWTNTVGRFVRTLSKYKPFDNINFSVGDDGRFNLRVSPKMTLDHSKSGIEGLTLNRERDGGFLLSFWGAMTSHRYTTVTFKREQEVHAYLKSKIALATLTDKRFEQKGDNR